MSRYVLKREEIEGYQGVGVSRIVSVFEDRGHTISRADAQAAWCAYSDSMCAGWMLLHESDDALFDEVASLCVEEVTSE